jgi:hypothetical protein
MEVEMNNQHCENCCFFDAGECLRYPPVLLSAQFYAAGGVDTDECEWGSPPVEEGNWCGEWSANDPR